MNKKIIVIGLGNFGSNLAIKLTEDGHEVFGIDKNMSKVDQLQKKIFHTLGFDATDEAALNHLPLDDSDLVVIAIGENVGSSITATALIKKYYKGRIIARSLNHVHKTVLEAMGIAEIIEPETEYAHELANRIMVDGAIKSMELHGEYEIVEITIPPKIIGKSLAELDMKHTYNSYIITVIKQMENQNFLGAGISEKEVYGVIHSTHIFKENDLLLVFGKKKDIDKFIIANS